MELNHSIPSVITDNSGVMRRLVAMLAKAGYTKIGFITESLEMSNINQQTAAAHTYPSLTTVAQNMKLLGKSCFIKLLDSIEGRDIANSQIAIKAKIIIRKSVKI